MKNIALTIVFSFVGLFAFSQTNKNSECVKYITTAPDGSVSMTIFDDSSEDSIKLEAADAFYKYQILDTRTAKVIYGSKNKGKECHIDKSKIAAGFIIYVCLLQILLLHLKLQSPLTVSIILQLKSVI